jgi:hypothetical protein
VIVGIVSGTESLRARPLPTADASEWSERLRQVSALWGDGWVLRQAISLIPDGADLEAIARDVTDADALLKRLLQLERNARNNRGDVEWWRSALQSTDGELQRRAWLFSIVTVAHSAVTISLAAEIDAAVAELSPKHFRSMERALTDWTSSPSQRRLVLHDALRTGHLKCSARTLWLFRPVSTDASQEQIDKKLTGAFEELLAPGMGDRRPLLRVLGRRKTVGVNLLKGTRELLPAGAWASDIKLGAMSANTAIEVLARPEEWPAEIVGRAIQHTATQLSGLPSVGQLAEANGWFMPAEKS